MEKIIFNFGALAEPFIQQVQKQGIKINPYTCDLFQADIDAINRLAIRGLTPESQRDRAIKRLMKRIQKAVGTEVGSSV
jgi:hypothetical protein